MDYAPLVFTQENHHHHHDHDQGRVWAWDRDPGALDRGHGHDDDDDDDDAQVVIPTLEVTKVSLFIVFQFPLCPGGDSHPLK